MRTPTKAVVIAATTAVLIPLFSPPAYAADDVPVLLGTNTSASAKADVLTDLAVAGGEIYSSYGDYDANTGPVDLNSLNITTGALTKQLTLNGEELKALRVIDGKVYAADVDPKAAWTANVGYATNAGGSWTYNAATPFQHVFDVAKSGSEIFLAGSVVNPNPALYGSAPDLAVIKKSADGGKTWTIAKARSSAGGSTAYDRYYWLANVNGKIAAIAEVRDASGATNRVLDVYSGGRWTTIDLGRLFTLAHRHEPTKYEVLGSRIILSDSNTTGYIDLNAKGKNGGVQMSNLPSGFASMDITVSDGVAYSIGNWFSGTGIDMTRNVVFATRDGVNWTKVATPAVVPATTYWNHNGQMVPDHGRYTSIAVANGVMYLGGDDAKIYTMRAPAVP